MNGLYQYEKEGLKALGNPNSNAYKDLKNEIIRQEVTNLSTENLGIIVDLIYRSDKQLGKRSMLPLTEAYSFGERLSNIGQAINNGNGIIATAAGPRYMRKNLGTGYVEYGPLLETLGKQKLAKNDKKNPNRQRLALDVFNTAIIQNPEVSPNILESMGARKYEMNNAKGKESHHIYPISYSGRVLSALEAIDLRDPVVKEMTARHLYVGDQAKNLAPLQTKENRLGPSEYLDKLRNEYNIDIHDKVHSTAETLLQLGGLPVRTNVAPGTTIEEFIADPNKTDFQKINYGIAVPLAHRAAMQANLLNLSQEDYKNGIEYTRDKTADKKMINTLVELAAVKAAAQTPMSPLTEKILSENRLIKRR